MQLFRKEYTNFLLMLQTDTGVADPTTLVSNNTQDMFV